MSREEMLQEELELVRCDLHNAYSWLEKEQQENEKLKSILNEVREVIIELRNIIYNPDYKNYGFSKEQYRNRFVHLFELLDKVGDK